MITLDLSILNQKGTPMFNSDLFANRPAAGIVGRIFISTDTKEFFRDTGTSWELIGGPGSGTITGSGAATQVAFWNGSSTISGSNNLWWDSTNNHLGINTNTPGTALDIHHNQSTILQLNQTTATNDTRIAFQNSGTALWRIGNFYTAGANDFSVFDVVGNLQQFTIVNTTGQTFVGAKTTASGRLVVNSATADAHLQVVGANAPSIRIDNAGSGGTQRFVFGLATATNNFIQGATAGEFCISTQSAGNMLFGMWQTTNASEVMRITTTNNLIVGSIVDNGSRFQVSGSGTFSNAVKAALVISDGVSNEGVVRIERVTVGVNTVIGALNFTNNNGSTIYGRLRGGRNAAGDGYVSLGTGISDSLFVLETGNVLAGSSVDNGNRLQVSGSATITNSVTSGSSIASGIGLIVANATNARQFQLGYSTGSGNNFFQVYDGAAFQDMAINALLFLNSSSNVSIGGSSVVSSAILDLISTGRGFLPPRMTTGQKNAISIPATGLIVYDTTLNKLCLFTGVNWETITSL